MGKYFGTDGFRGEANIDLTVEHAYKVGRFLGWHLGKEKKRPKSSERTQGEAATCLNTRW